MPFEREAAAVRPPPRKCSGGPDPGVPATSWEVAILVVLLLVSATLKATQAGVGEES
jgi:hypothetical protein